MKGVIKKLCHMWKLWHYGVSRSGMRDMCIKINLLKGNYGILRIGLMGSLSSLQKSEFLKMIILSFHEKF